MRRTDKRDPDVSDIEVVLGVFFAVLAVALFLATAGIAAQGCQDSLLHAAGFPK